MAGSVLPQDASRMLPLQTLNYELINNKQMINYNGRHHAAAGSLPHAAAAGTKL
jgi:hypothetical protein